MVIYCFELPFGIFVEPAFAQGEALFWKLVFAPFLLALPISAAYLQWLLRPRPVPWIWRTGYTLAVLMGLGLLVGYGWLLVLVDVGLYVYASCEFAALGAGAWLVMRNRRVGVPHALNALIALQVVYVAGALVIAVVFVATPTIVPGWTFPGWGALFIVLTVVVYVVQMVLGSRQQRARV